MLTEICQYLKNWFNRKPDGGDYPKYSGTFTVSGGMIVELSGKLADGQYFRVLGSVFNDGVHKVGDDSLTDEVFEGAVWSMAVPPVVVALAEDIAAWQAKYGGADGAALSPFQSESFGGYSYSKGTGYATNADNDAATGWQGTFKSRLEPWRKM